MRKEAVLPPWVIVTLNEATPGWLHPVIVYVTPLYETRLHPTTVALFSSSGDAGLPHVVKKIVVKIIANIAIAINMSFFGFKFILASH